VASHAPVVVDQLREASVSRSDVTSDPRDGEETPSLRGCRSRCMRQIERLRLDLLERSQTESSGSFGQSVSGGRAPTSPSSTRHRHLLAGAASLPMRAETGQLDGDRFRLPRRVRPCERSSATERSLPAEVGCRLRRRFHANAATRSAVPGAAAGCSDSPDCSASSVGADVSSSPASVDLVGKSRHPVVG
jgi:hypothetical protein